MMEELEKRVKILELVVQVLYENAQYEERLRDGDNYHTYHKVEEAMKLLNVSKGPNND